MDYITLPRTDLIQSVMALLAPLAPTVLTGDEAMDKKTWQFEYPQIIVQMPLKRDTPQYKLVQTGTYSVQIDFYWNADQKGSFMDALDKAEILLPHLKLKKYSCDYQSGSLVSPQPQVDTTTSMKLLHGVIAADFLINEI